MMGWLGAVPLAAHQVALSCAAFTFMFSLGLSMAVGMRVGAAAGAGEHSRLRPIWIGGTWIVVIMGGAFGGAFLAFGRAISYCFIDDPAVVSTATALLVVASAFQVFDGGQVMNSAALRGLTDAKVPAAITFVAYWVIALPLGYALGIRGGFGPSGVWTGLAAGLAFAAVLLGVRFVRLTRPGAPAGR